MTHDQQVFAGGGEAENLKRVPAMFAISTFLFQIALTYW
jgi:hypothetical protein